MRIFYFCPDFSSPSGGTRCLYQHVWQMVQRGYNAYIVHDQEQFRLTWHGIDVPVTYLKDQLYTEADAVLVVPEGCPALMQQLAHLPGKKVVIALSWAYIFSTLPDKTHWRDYGFTHVITPSKRIQDFIAWSLDMNAHYIETYLDPTVFSNDAKLKKDIIAYMGRKSHDGTALQKIAQLKPATLGRYQWVELNNAPLREYSETFKQARFYLSLGIQEGLNISALEAMSAGCIVIGYSGGGGLDYMVSEGEKQNCFLVENGDLLQLGITLQKSIEALKEEPQHMENIIKNAANTAAQFCSLTDEANSLENYFINLMHEN